MEILTTLNLQSNVISDLVLNSDTTYPVNPTVGAQVFINGRVYVATDIALDGTPTWIPTTNDVEGSTTVQGIASASWVIPNTFDDNSVVAQFFNSAGISITPTAVDLSVPNQITATFATPQTGKAVIIHRVKLKRAGVTSGNSGSDNGVEPIVNWALFDNSLIGEMNWDPSSQYVNGVWNGGSGNDTSESNIVRLSATRFAYLNEAGIQNQENDDYAISHFSTPKTGADATGLANDTTEYRAEFQLDGWSVYKGLMVVGSTVQSITDLITALDTQLQPEARCELVNGNIKITSNNTDFNVAQVYPYSTSINDSSNNLFASLTDFTYLHDGTSGSMMAVYEVNPVDNSIVKLSSTNMPTGDAEDDDAVAMDANTVFYSCQAYGNGHKYAIAKIDIDGAVTDGGSIEVLPSRGTNITMAKVSSNTVLAVTNVDDNSRKLITGIVFSTANDNVTEVGRADELANFDSFTSTFGQDAEKNGESLSIRYNRVVPLTNNKALLIVWFTYDWNNADWSQGFSEPQIKAFVIDTTSGTPTVISTASVTGVNAENPAQFQPTDGTGGVLYFSDRDTGAGTAISFKVANDVITASSPVVLCPYDIDYELSFSRLGNNNFMAVQDSSYYDSGANDGNGAYVNRSTITIFELAQDGTPTLINNVDMDGVGLDWPLLINLDGHRVALVSETDIPDPNNEGSTLGGVMARIIYQP